MADITKLHSRDLAQLYEKEFQPDNYMATRYSKTVYRSYVTNFLGTLHRIFNIDIGDKESMLDLGCGPTVYSTISASRHVKAIVCSDFVDKNLEEIRKWVNREPGAFDQSRAFEEVAKLECLNDAKGLEERVRTRIKSYIHCDVMQANPIAPLTERFDVVFSSLMFESVATSEQTFAQVISNSANLVQDGGYFIYGGVFGCSHYYSGTVVFPAFPTTRSLVDRALNAANLQPVLWTVFPRIGDDEVKGDFNSSFLVLAKKRNPE